MGSVHKSPSVKSKELLAILTEVKQGSSTVIKLIKDYPNWNKIEISEVFTNQNKWNLLHLSSWHGNHQLCKELIRLGIDSNALDNVIITQQKETPLHLAAVRGHYKTVQVLLETSEPQLTNIVIFNQKGQTAQDLADENGHANVSELIKKNTKTKRVVEDLY